MTGVRQFEHPVATVTCSNPPLRVCLVGRGRPEQGGIPVVLEQLVAFDDGEVTMSLVNLGRERAAAGGRFVPSAMGRTLIDLARVTRAALDHDLVHVHSAVVPTPTLVRTAALTLAGRLGGARVVVHVHGGLLPRWMTSDRRRALARRCLRPADRVVTVAAPIFSALEPVVEPDRLCLIENAVDVARFHPSEPATGEPGRATVPARVLYVGHLSEQKGIVELLDASDRLLASGCDHRLILAGDDRLPTDVAARLGAAHIDHLGPVDRADMPELYRSADVFCLPSHWEAMPLSVLEAMASGLAVVATEVGHLPRMIDDGRTGLLVPVASSDALARSLGDLLTASGERCRLGAAARIEAESRFAEATLRHRLIELYREVLR